MGLDRDACISAEGKAYIINDKNVKINIVRLI
jgi:hypothetical protein